MWTKTVNQPASASRAKKRTPRGFGTARRMCGLRAAWETGCRFCCKNAAKIRIPTRAVTIFPALGISPPGVDFIPSALRELKEELGYTARPEQLILCGQRRVCVDDVFHGKPFHDRQVSRVYLIWVEDEPTFTLQTEEVSAVRWIDLDDCLRAVSENSFPHCISLEELHLLEVKLRT